MSDLNRSILDSSSFSQSTYLRSFGSILLLVCSTMLAGSENLTSSKDAFIHIKFLSLHFSLPLLSVSKRRVVSPGPFFGLEVVDLKLEPLSMDHAPLLPGSITELQVVLRISVQVVESELFKAEFPALLNHLRWQELICHGGRKFFCVSSLWLWEFILLNLCRGCILCFRLPNCILGRSLWLRMLRHDLLVGHRRW